MLHRNVEYINFFFFLIFWWLEQTYSIQSQHITWTLWDILGAQHCNCFESCDLRWLWTGNGRHVILFLQICRGAGKYLDRDSLKKKGGITKSKLFWWNKWKNTLRKMSSWVFIGVDNLFIFWIRILENLTSLSFSSVLFEVDKWVSYARKWVSLGDGSHKAEILQKVIFSWPCWKLLWWKREAADILKVFC